MKKTDETEKKNNNAYTEEENCRKIWLSFKTDYLHRLIDDSRAAGESRKAINARFWYTVEMLEVLGENSRY